MRGAVGGGGLGTGLILLVGGLLLKSSQSQMVAECNSGLGRLGQVLDPSAASNCSSAQDLSSLATAGIWLGAIMLAFIVGGLILAGLIGAGILASSRQRRSAPAAGEASVPGRPGTPGAHRAGSRAGNAP